MNKKRLKAVSRISIISFVCSSGSLLFIPFLNITAGLNAFAYTIAALFWLGLLLGISLQIFLTVKLKGIKKKKLKHQRIFYIVSAVCIFLLVLLILFKVNIMMLFVLLIFISIISLEAASVTNKEMYIDELQKT